MKQASEKKYFDVLEVPTDASESQIRKAYWHLKELYSKESIVSVPVEDEITKEQKKDILDQIEKAYSALIGIHEKKPQNNIKTDTEKISQKELQAITAEITAFSGHDLKKIREHLGLDLIDICSLTKIQVQNLKNIESENYENLPPEVFIRGFVKSYSNCLSLDSKKVVSDYMIKYKIWKQTLKVKGKTGLFSRFKIKRKK